MMAAKKDVPEYSVSTTKTAHSLQFFRTLDGFKYTFNGSKREQKFMVDKILKCSRWKG